MSSQFSAVERPAYRPIAQFALLISALLMIGSEAEAVHGLWFKQGSHHLGVKPYYALPLLIAFPLVTGIMLVVQIRRRSAGGEIGEGLESRLALGVSALLLVVYTCIFTLIEFAFS